MAITTTTDFYKLKNNNSKVKLQIKVGYGQISSTVVKLDGKKVGSNYKNSFDLDIGDSNSLIKKVLHVTTSITDIQSETDKISFSIKITGGDLNYFKSNSKTVNPSGSTETYDYTINFK